MTSPPADDALRCEVCRSPAGPTGYVVLAISDEHGVATVQRVRLVCSNDCERPGEDGSAERLLVGEVARRNAFDLLDTFLARFDWNHGTVREFAEIVRRARMVRGDP